MVKGACELKHARLVTGCEGQGIASIGPVTLIEQLMRCKRSVPHTKVHVACSLHAIHDMC